MDTSAEKVIDSFVNDYISNIQKQADIWWPQFLKYIQKSNQILNPEEVAQSYLAWMMVLDWVGGRDFLPEALPSYAWPKIAHKIGYRPEYLLRWQFVAQDFFKYRGLATKGPRLFDLYLDIYRYPDNSFEIKKEKRLVYDLVDSIGIKIKESSILQTIQ